VAEKHGKTTKPIKMKKSLFAVMAVFGGLAAAQAQRATLDGIPGAIEREAGTPSGGLGPWTMLSRMSFLNWQGFRPGILPSSGLEGFRSTDGPSAAKPGQPAGTKALFFTGSLPDGGLWPAAGSFEDSALVTMSPLAGPTLADGEFRALLSLIDGAAIRTRTADAQMRWVFFAYCVSALLLGLLVVIYLPWNARPPVGSSDDVRVSTNSGPLTS